MVSVVTNFLWAVSVLLWSITLSNGIVVLETEDDISGWTQRTCIYANAYTDFEYAPCRVPVTGDNEQNDGYWSFCDNSACRLTYKVKDVDGPITALRIRVFVVPNDAITRPIIRVTYYNQVGANIFEDFPVVAGWGAIEYEFREELIAGATIEVRQTGTYEAGKEFSMIDRIILSNGLDEPIPTVPTIPTTTPGASSTRPPTTPTTQRSTTTRITTITQETTVQTTTEGNGIPCPPNGIVFLPDPTNCAKFYICAEGEAYPSECAPGLLFDPLLGKCNIASEVRCSCPQEQGISFMPIYGTCQNYTICVDGVGTEWSCADGTEFSPEADTCVLASEYDCPYTRDLVHTLAAHRWF